MRPYGHSRMGFILFFIFIFAEGIAELFLCGARWGVGEKQTVNNTVEFWPLRRYNSTV